MSGSPSPVLATSNGVTIVTTTVTVLDEYGTVSSIGNMKDTKLPSTELYGKGKGKLHGAETPDLPKPGEFWQYSRDALELLLSQLRESMAARIASTAKEGPNATRMQNKLHGERQAAEQSLIRELENFLFGK